MRKDKKIQNIYYDLETTSLDPQKAMIIEATFIIEDKFFTTKVSLLEEVEKPVQFLIKLAILYKEMYEDPKSSLDFHGLTPLEFVKHNTGVMTIDEFVKELRKFLDKNLKNKTPRFCGWNSSRYDDLILEKYLEEDFVYKRLDVMDLFKSLKEKQVLESCSLEKVHTKLIGSRDEEMFHSSFSDAMATKELHEWFQKNVKINLVDE